MPAQYRKKDAGSVTSRASHREAALRDCESGGQIVRRTVERVTDKGSWSLEVQADNWQVEPMQPEVRLSLTDCCFRSTQLVAGFSDPDVTWLGYVFLVRR